MNGGGTKQCIRLELLPFLVQHPQWVVLSALQVGTPTAPPLSLRLPWLPLPPRGGAELENLPRGQDWRRYLVLLAGVHESSSAAHVHRTIMETTRLFVVIDGLNLPRNQLNHPWLSSFRRIGQYLLLSSSVLLLLWYLRLRILYCLWRLWLLGLQRLRHWGSSGLGIDSEAAPREASSSRAAVVSGGPRRVADLQR